MSPQTERAAGPRDRRALRVALCVALSLLTAVAFATPAMASEAIDSFNTTTSDTSAGAHPDFTTSFTLHNPGAPEAAQNVIFNAPEGLFGNPYAITHCTSSDFALDQCPSNSQAGLVTVYDSSGLLGTAPIFDVEPQGDQTALFAFIVPILNIPINIPVAVRTGGDYGLRFTVQDISQSTPLAGADLTFWGFPADSSHDLQRFPKGFPGNPSNCPELTDTSCLGQPVLGQRARSPAHRQPDHLLGSADHQPHRADLPGSEHPDHAAVELPGDHGLRSGGLQPRPLLEPDHQSRRTLPRASTSS